MKIGKLIKDYMFLNRITIRPLAKELGMSPTTLFRFLNGKETKMDTFIKIWNWLLNE